MKHFTWRDYAVAMAIAAVVAVWAAVCVTSGQPDDVQAAQDAQDDLQQAKADAAAKAKP